MNILLVADYAAPYEGNFINSIKKLEEKVIENNGKIIYSFPEKAQEIEWIVELGKTRKVIFHSRDIRNNKKMFYNEVLNEKIDVIYSHFCIPRTQLAIKIVSKQTKTRLVQHYHNHYQLPKNILKSILIKWSFEGDLNIGCSESVAKSIPYKNVVAVPNAINFERLDKYENIKIADEDKKVILMFGFDYKRKGVDIAINSLKDIAEKYNIVLAISVSVKLDELKNKIEEEFGEVPNFVRFLEPRDDIATYYHASDIFLSAAREEGLCYSNIEAVYCGCKCIFSNLKEQPLDIPGIVSFESENVKDLKKQIVEIIENSDIDNLNKKIQSKEYVIKRYDLRQWVENIYECLEK